MNPYKKLRDTLIEKEYRILARYVGRAIVRYDMIHKDDRVLVALSGGKDSFSCLHLLDYHRKRAPFDYDITGCYVDMGFGDLDVGQFEKHLKDYGFKYVIKKSDVFKDARDENISCFWCSWNRRKILFQACRETGCNKLVLGHNLDDIIQTTLLNMIFHGEISTSPPVLDLFGGATKIIRPLCLLEESLILKFARALNLPLSDYECPYKEDSRRTLIRNMIDNIAREHPHVKVNIYKSLNKVRQDYLV